MLRRSYLLVSILFSFAYPLFSLKGWLKKQEPIMSAIAAIQLDEFVITPSGALNSSVFTLENVLWGIFGLVVLILLIQLFLQLYSIFMHRIKGVKSTLQGIPIIKMDEKIMPFSFFRWIFINPNQHTETETAEILEHELTHVRQCHSADVVVSQIQKIICWFNPAAWLLAREIRFNLEFLADNQVLKSGFEPKKYQYHLLSLTYESADNKLGNQFNVLPIKKRIKMMNSKKTKKTGLLKYALIIPIALTMLIMNAMQEIIASTKNEIEPAAVTELTTLVNNEIQQPVKSQTKNTPDVVISIEDVPANKSAKSAETATLKEHNDDKNNKLNEMVVVGYSSDDKETSVSEQDVFELVETPPSFPGGEKAMYDYLAKEIRYPVEAQKQKIEGRVMVQFIVNDQGKVIRPKIASSMNPLLDAEALRVINSMPNWIPGKQGGKNVNVRYTMPIQFKLTGNNSSESEKKKLSGNIVNIQVKDIADAKKEDIDQKELEIPNSTLIILDGNEISVEKLKEIVPEKIKEISVLKDKSATEIYGEKGKNGVIIITTKK
jgi:TonB family protein